MFCGCPSKKAERDFGHQTLDDVSPEVLAALNRFCVRLVFCLHAEDDRLFKCCRCSNVADIQSRQAIGTGDIEAFDETHVHCVIVGTHVKKEHTDSSTPNGVCDSGNESRVSDEQNRLVKVKTILGGGRTIRTDHINACLAPKGCQNPMLNWQQSSPPLRKPSLTRGRCTLNPCLPPGAPRPTPRNQESLHTSSIFTQGK